MSVVMDGATSPAVQDPSGRPTPNAGSHVPSVPNQTAGRCRVLLHRLQ